MAPRGAHLHRAGLIRIGRVFDLQGRKTRVALTFSYILMRTYLTRPVDAVRIFLLAGRRRRGSRHVLFEFVS